MSTTGFFIIIRGPLGVGKSTVAKLLAKHLGARRIAIDDILASNGLEHDTEDGYVSQRSFIAANQLAASEALPLLQQGVPVIFDGNFYWKSQLDDLIRSLPFPYFIFTLMVPLETCMQRDKNRNASNGRDAVEAVYKKSTAFSFGTPIDATRTPEDAVRAIRKQLPS